MGSVYFVVAAAWHCIINRPRQWPALWCTLPVPSLFEGVSCLDGCCELFCPATFMVWLGRAAFSAQLVRFCKACKRVAKWHRQVSLGSFVPCVLLPNKATSVFRCAWQQSGAAILILMSVKTVGWRPTNHIVRLSPRHLAACPASLKFKRRAQLLHTLACWPKWPQAR
jgi:hypothetical protein